MERKKKSCIGLGATPRLLCLAVTSWLLCVVDSPSKKSQDQKRSRALEHRLRICPNSSRENPLCPSLWFVGNSSNRQVNTKYPSPLISTIIRNNHMPRHHGKTSSFCLGGLEEKAGDFCASAHLTKLMGSCQTKSTKTTRASTMNAFRA